MKKIEALALTGLVVIASSVFAYHLVKNPELRRKIKRGAQDMVDTSRKTFTTMSEDVMLRTAQMTRNPKINQEWIATQWEIAEF